MKLIGSKGNFDSGGGVVRAGHSGIEAHYYSFITCSSTSVVPARAGGNCGL